MRPCNARQRVHINALFGGGGGGGNPFDMGKMMENVKKAQEMVQVETQRMQKDLANTEFEGFDEDETVRVVLSGNQEPRSVDVTQAAMEVGAEELSRRVTAALKDSHVKSVAGMREKMKELSRNLGIPGGMLPGM